MITTSKTKKGWADEITFLRIPESAILASVFSFCHMDPLLDTFCLTYPPFLLAESKHHVVLSSFK